MSAATSATAAAATQAQSLPELHSQASKHFGECRICAKRFTLVDGYLCRLSLTSAIEEALFRKTMDNTDRSERDSIFGALLKTQKQYHPAYDEFSVYCSILNHVLNPGDLKHDEKPAAAAKRLDKQVYASG